MEGDPFSLLEGMAIAGLAVGATKGVVYIRSEYPDAVAAMREAVRIARDRGVLGADVLGSGRAFDVAVRVGAGSYVCGEETAMLDSLEGLRGMVRAKPPLPARHGPVRAADGREQRAHARHGPGDPRPRGGGLPGARARPLARHPGLPAGRQRRPRRHRRDRVRDHACAELVDGYGGGTRSGRPVRAVQVGGPLGAYLPADRLDVPLDYEAHGRRAARCSATAGWWSSTTPSTWPRRRGSRWSSAPRSRAARARRAASARCAASR